MFMYPSAWCFGVLNVVVNAHSFTVKLLNWFSFAIIIIIVIIIAEIKYKHALSLCHMFYRFWPFSKVTSMCKKTGFSLNMYLVLSKMFHLFWVCKWAFHFEIKLAKKPLTPLVISFHIPSTTTNNSSYSNIIVIIIIIIIIKTATITILN